MNQWRFEMFGGFRAVREAVDTRRFRTRQTGALLAYLAYHPGPHIRDALIEICWPGVETKTGRGNLSLALFALRGLLEPAPQDKGTVLIADRYNVCLTPAGFQSDVQEFSRLLDTLTRPGTGSHLWEPWQRILEIYRGPLLAGYYDGWILPEQERLSQEFLRVASLVSDALERAGHLERALECVRRMVALEPLHEEAHARLIRLYLVGNQHSAARLQYRRLETLLRREFNTQPLPETRALLQQTKAKGTPVGTVATAAEVYTPATLPVPPSSLVPVWLNAFFGRETEMASLESLLLVDGVRLITIVGVGGVGKTRLAGAIMERMRMRFQDRAYFVPLAEAQTTTQVLDAIGTAVRVKRDSETDPLELVASALRGENALMVLDNLEHLGDDAVLVVHRLLSRLPNVRCLATSRRLLAVSGEQAFPLSPLESPAAQDVYEQYAKLSSVRLYVDRAQKIRPDFRLNARNMDSVASLCRLLDGLPLAIELAAARANSLTPGQMVHQMQRRFAFLVSKRIDFADRHRSLQATLAWSEECLPAETRRFFACVSVFRGGWTIEAAQFVADVADPLEHLETLLRHSLIFAEVREGAMRYRMLETVREFAKERLQERGETLAVCRRHLLFFAENHPRNVPSIAEIENVWAAAHFAVDADDALAPTLGLTLISAWEQWFRWRDALEWYTRLLRTTAAHHDPAVRVRLLLNAVLLARWLGERETAGLYIAEAEQIARRHADKVLLRKVIDYRGMIALQRGDVVEARERFQEALSLAQKTGGGSEIDDIRFSQMLLALWEGDFPEAERRAAEITVPLFLPPVALYRTIVALRCGALDGLEQQFEGLEIEYRESPMRLAQIYAQRGHLARRTRQTETAMDAYARALVLCRDTEHLRMVAEVLEGVIGLLADWNCAEEGVRLFGAVDGLRERLWLMRDSYEQDVCAAFRTQFQRSLSPALFDRMYAEGLKLSWRAAVEFALSLISEKSSDSQFPSRISLSAKEP